MLLSALLFACSDPVQEYSIPKKTDDNWEDWSQKPAAQQGAPVGEAIGKPPQDGVPPNPQDPAQGAQDEPPEGAVPQPPAEQDGNAPPLVPSGEAQNAANLDEGDCRPVASSEMLAPTEGEGIELTGNIKKPDGIVGSVLLEFAKSSGEQSQTHYGVVCGFTDSYTVEIPAGLSDVYVVAFVDVNGDGPSAEDPRGLIGPISPSQSGELDDITVEIDSTISPLSLPFAPYVNNIPVVNEGDNTNPPPVDTDALPPPTTDVGVERETPDLPAAEGEPREDLPPPVDGPPDEDVDGPPQGGDAPENGTAPEGEAP